MPPRIQSRSKVKGHTEAVFFIRKTISPKFFRRLLLVFLWLELYHMDTLKCKRREEIEHLSLVISLVAAVDEWGGTARERRLRMTPQTTNGSTTLK